MNRLLSPENLERLMVTGETSAGFLFTFAINAGLQWAFNPLMHPEFRPGMQSFVTLLIHEYPQLLVAAMFASGGLHLLCLRRGDGRERTAEFYTGLGLGFAGGHALGRELVTTSIGAVLGIAGVVGYGRQVMEDFVHPRVANLNYGVVGVEEIHE